jgi:hypothetical protein
MKSADISTNNSQKEPASLSRRAMLLTITGSVQHSLYMWLPSHSAQAKAPAIARFDKGGAGERDVYTTATGLKYAEVSAGTGDPSRCR